MKRETKHVQVAEMHEKLKLAKAVFLADFRGMSVEKATTLRNELRAASVEYKVFKNTLLDLAAKETDVACLSPYLAGPTAVAISYDDPVGAAKVLSKFAKDPQGAFALKAGMLSGKLLDVAQIQALADLPSREVLHRQDAGLHAGSRYQLRWCAGRSSRLAGPCPRRHQSTKSRQLVTQ